MSVRVNWRSVNDKIRSAVNSPEAKTNREKMVGGILSGNKSVTIGTGKNKMTIHTAIEAAEEYVNILRQTVEGLVATDNLSDKQGEAILSNINIGAPVDNGDGTCTIHIGLDRGGSPSLIGDLYPEYSEGISDLVLLFDRGVDHVMNQVWREMEDGKVRYGQRVFPTLNFIDESINVFIGTRGTKYNVIDVVQTDA